MPAQCTLGVPLSCLSLSDSRALDFISTVTTASAITNDTEPAWNPLPTRTPQLVNLPPP
jgi:hypothetical protein